MHAIRNMVVVLMVAEKPSLARSLADLLSGKQSRRRKSLSNACDVYEFDGQLPLSDGRGGYSRMIPAHFKMTSVCGHVMSLDFLPAYNNWEKTNPVELFAAETMKKEALPNLKITSFLRQEGRGVDYLVLWLDCDKEGENICFEVIDEVQPVMKPSRSHDPPSILRARFSSITETAVKQAFRSLVLPNLNEARSVDARQELDLRIGCSFTRFQTKLFQSQYSGLNHSVISYGPCQTPTLGFCVQRHDEIQQFKPEKYWKLDCKLRSGSTTVMADWNRERVFDSEVVHLFHSILKKEDQAVVLSVSSRPHSKPPPPALHTVELLRAASQRLHIGPKQAMDIAEKLYIEGYISYPRTETTQYSPDFELKPILQEINHNPEYQQYTSALLREKIKIPSSGHDVGDHPPITPMKNAHRHQLSDIQWKVYDLVVTQFIASLMPECKYKHTEVDLQLGRERFQWTGNTIISPGFTALCVWMAVGGPEVTVEFEKGQKWAIDQLRVTEHMTTPPGYISESELITLMEKHGIGTDASIPAHIENICTRNYVKIDSGRKLVPTTLGIVLVHGYQKIDPELVQPTMRTAIEQQLNLIAKGKVDYTAVVGHTLGIFQQKFEYFHSNISVMDELFEATFSTVASTARPLSRCGQCMRYMTLVPSKPQRLHCKHCDETYSLPQGGTIKLYKELKCPLDGFEIVIFSDHRGKTYTLCPFCYNKPPYKGTIKNMPCSHCPNTTCPHARAQLRVDDCPSCETGQLILDPTSGPKWKMCCNNIVARCNTVIHFFEGAHKIEREDKICEECGAHELLVDFKKSDTPLVGGQTKHIGCYQCDTVLAPLVKTADNERWRSHRGRGRGRRRGRGRGRARHF